MVIIPILKRSGNVSQTPFEAEVAIAALKAQDHAKGSARSIEQVSMFEILNAHTDLITKFGGHHMAVWSCTSVGIEKGVSYRCVVQCSRSG